MRIIRQAMRDTVGLFTSILMCAAASGVITGVMAQTSDAFAQSASSVSNSHLTVQEFSAQARGIFRRSPRRVFIYRSANQPGPNSVRICNARYEQEFRPSGTVIVPRVSCYWSG